MLCVVTQPDNAVIELELDPKAEGLHCMEKVCQHIGIIEEDYFGLQYKGTKGEQLWLNTRNRITRQVPGPPPYRFRLRVKFFVQPHLILQEETRHLFYLTVRDDFVNGILKLRSREQELDMAAHIAQAELGDLCKHSPHHCASYPSFCPETFRSCTDHLAQVAHRHEQLAGMKTNNAEYRMLQFAETAENFGVEFHQAKDLSTGQDLNIGVGPGGIILYSMQTNQVQFSIPYPTVQMAIHNGKDFHLTVVRDNGSQHTQGFRLVSQRAADALYRCVTEMHSFYRCDTVRNAVSGQFSRDLKGTLASLFNENTTLGKRYIFDIRRTCREVCDHARRVLYTTGRDVLRKPRAEGESVQDCHQCEGAACPLDKFDSQMEHQDSPYTQVEEEESLLCRVCMDANIDITFGPCCHTVCCHSCMRRLDHCPICRAPIESIQRIVPQEEMCTLEL